MVLNSFSSFPVAKDPAAEAAAWEYGPSLRTAFGLTFEAAWPRL